MDQRGIEKGRGLRPRWPLSANPLASAVATLLARGGAWTAAASARGPAPFGARGALSGGMGAVRARGRKDRGEADRLRRGEREEWADACAARDLLRGSKPKTSWWDPW